MSRYLAIAAIAALMCASSAYAANDAQNALPEDFSKATTQADCEKAGGSWDAQANGCAEKSAKMGKDEGTHEGANLSTNPKDDTKKVDQPPRTND